MDAKWVMQAHQSTMDKTSVNIKAKTTIRRHKSKHTKSFQKVQEMITNMKEKFVQNFFDDAELNGAVTVLLKSKKNRLTMDMQHLLYFVLKCEIYHVSNNFVEFNSLSMFVQARLLKKNTSALSKMGLLKFIYNFLSEIPADASDISECYRILYLDKWITGTVSSNEQPPASCLKKFVYKFHRLVNEDKNIFMFMFLLVLFDSTDEECLKDTLIPGYELYFMQQLQHYLLMQNQNHAVASIRLGMANELLNDLQKL